MLGLGGLTTTAIVDVQVKAAVASTTPPVVRLIDPPVLRKPAINLGYELRSPALTYPFVPFMPAPHAQDNPIRRIATVVADYFEQVNLCLIQPFRASSDTLLNPVTRKIVNNLSLQDYVMDNWLVKGRDPAIISPDVFQNPMLRLRTPVADWVFDNAILEEVASEPFKTFQHIFEMPQRGVNRHPDFIANTFQNLMRSTAKFNGWIIDG